MAITLMTQAQSQMAQGLFEKHGSDVLKNPAFVDLARQVGAKDVHELYAKVNGWVLPAQVERLFTPSDCAVPAFTHGLPPPVESFHRAVGLGTWAVGPLASVTIGVTPTHEPWIQPDHDKARMKDWLDKYLVGRSIRDTNLQNQFAANALKNLESWSTAFQNQMENLREMVRNSPGSDQANRMAQDMGSQLRNLLEEKERNNYLWLDTQILGYANDTKDQIRPGYDVNKNNLG